MKRRYCFNHRGNDSIHTLTNPYLYILYILASHQHSEIPTCYSQLGSTKSIPTLSPSPLPCTPFSNPLSLSLLLSSLFQLAFYEVAWDVAAGECFHHLLLTKERWTKREKSILWPQPSGFLLDCKYVTVIKECVVVNALVASQMGPGRGSWRVMTPSPLNTHPHTKTHTHGCTPAPSSVLHKIACLRMI